MRPCWDRDPARRPTFEEIYAQFESGAVDFPGGERSGTEVLLREIHQHEMVVREALSHAAESVNAVFELRAKPATEAGIQETLTQQARAGDVMRMTRLLMAHLDKANVNGKDSAGFAPLHAAVESSRMIVVQFLMKIESVDKNVRNAEGHTPLMEAVKQVNPRMVAYLAQGEGVDVNAQNGRGLTALHLAELLARDEHEEMARALTLGKGLRTDVADATGKTPFQGSARILGILAEKPPQPESGKRHRKE